MERSDMLDAPTSLSESRYWECIAACARCALLCDFCAAACLRDVHAEHMLNCVALNMDCADACRMTAAALSRDTPHVSAFCELCARVCESCATECENHDADHCQDCAESCRHCAELCRELVA